MNNKTIDYADPILNQIARLIADNLTNAEVNSVQTEQNSGTYWTVYWKVVIAKAVAIQTGLISESSK